MTHSPRNSSSGLGRSVIILIACALCGLLWRPVIIGYHLARMSYAYDETFHPERLWPTRLRALFGLPAASPPQPPWQLSAGLAAIVHHRGALEVLGHFRRTVMDLPAVSLTSSNASMVSETIGHLNSAFPYFELRLDSTNTPSKITGITIVAPQEQLDSLRAQFDESIKDQAITLTR